jgi:hypothetical protein
LETSLNVKSSVVTKEEVTVARDGKILDERSRETKENNSYSSTTSEIWEPIGVIQRPRNFKPFDSSDDSRPNSNASSDQGYTTNTSSNNVLRERGGAAVGTNGDVADCCLAGMSGLGLEEDAREGGAKLHGVHNTTSAVRHDDTSCKARQRGWRPSRPSCHV